MSDASLTHDRPLRVLVVDDNRDAADSLADLARCWGHDSRVAYDGASGLRAAAEWRPDCCVLDIGLPGMSGYELARQLRRLPGLSAVRLIAHTAYAGPIHQRQAAEAGFDHDITKPADPERMEALLAMMNRIAALAERTEELARQNVSLAGEARELLREVKDDIREVKEEVRELKQEVRELKEGEGAE